MTEKKPMHILGLSPLAWVMNLLILALLCIILTLPPVSLLDRITTLGYTSVSAKDGATVKDTDGTQIAISANAVAKSAALKVSEVSSANFANDPRAQSFPANLDRKSPLYQVNFSGERPSSATLTIPTPNDSEPYTTLDLYGLYNDLWFKLPFTPNTTDMVLESHLNFTPDAFVVVQTQAQAPILGATVTSQNPTPDQARAVVTEINPTGLFVGPEGAIAGDVIASPALNSTSNLLVVPTISNLSATSPRVDLVENMLFAADQRKIHVNALTDLAVQKLYNGINVDYRGLSPDDQDNLTLFIKELASALHAKNKTLSVVLPIAKQLSEDQWDTTGYDWALIGRYADEVKISLPNDPKAYEGDPSAIAAYLQWAVSQVDRYKLQILYSPAGTDTSGNTTQAIAYNDALKLFGAVSLPSSIEPAQAVTIDLPKLRDAGGINYAQASGLYSFTYKDDKGATHMVVLENADSLGRKAALATQFNLRGLTLSDLDKSAGVDTRVWDTLKQYQAQQQINVSSNIALLWLLDGKPLGKSPTNDPKYFWTAPSQTGNFTLAFALTADGTTPLGTQKLGETKIQVALKPTPTPTPLPKPTATPAPTRAPVAANPAPAQPAAPSSNFTGKNLFGYGTQLNWQSSPIGSDGEFGTLNSMGFGWAKIQVRWCDLQGSPGAPNLSSLDNITSIAKAHNIKLLFSVVCGPTWTGASAVDGNPGPPNDPGQLGQIMGGMAQRYCNGSLGAIEVWNETNLSREWGPRPINGADYLTYLKVAYTAIKQNCPSIVVVSGAPTPTGVTNQYAKQDSDYLQEMYSAGLKQYSDAIGIHPSGYNVPVDCDITSASCPNSGQTWLAPWNSRHYSFSFLSMMNTYHRIMVANGDGSKQVWATEFGWGVSGSPAPGYEYERDNSPDKQSQWLVKAYQYAKSWGWVGVMFVWNLDFNNSNADNRAFAILNTPALGALSAMPK